MKTKFKSIITGLLCATLLSSVCSAASFEFDIIDTEAEKKLIITGTLDDVKKGDGIRIEILKKGMQSSEIADAYDKELLKDHFILLRQVPADENGGYTVTANMNKEGRGTGWYVVRVNGEDNEIYFALKEAKQELIDKIVEICKKGDEETEEEAKVRATGELETLFDLANVNDSGVRMSEVVLNFNITDEVVFDVTASELAEKFYLMAGDVSVDNFVEKMSLSAYITALCENKIDIIDYKGELGLDATYVTAYTDKLTSENKASFTADYFKDKNYETKESVQEAFKTAVLDSWCSYFNGYADVEEYIKDFGAVVGVDMEDYADLDKNEKPELHEYLAGKEGFSSTEVFAKAANDKMKELLDDEGGSGGSSGSGSNSGGIGGGTIVTPGIKPIENVPTEPGKGSSFNDMEGFDWAKEAVEALSLKGIVSGTGSGKYEPERNVTREEMLVMILRAFGIEIGEEVSDFTDAAADGWYNAYLAAAKKAGFVSGKPDGSFGVGEAVTREDAAVMAYNIAKAKGTAFNTEKGEVFADDADVADYANEAVYALKNAEVINGKGEGMFAPKANCTRAEAAKIIYTLIK